MTRIISPSFPSTLVQEATDPKQKDLLTSLDDGTDKQLLDIPCLTELTGSSPSTIPKPTSSDSDTDDDNKDSGGLTQPLLTNAQRKRAQNAAFEHFVREKDECLLKKFSEEGEKSTEGEANSNGSISARRIIDRVRDYQSELFARAKAGNIIAVLDTGSGKTLIAALLLKEIVAKELEDRASGKSPRMSFFLVRHQGCLSHMRADMGWYCRQIAWLLRSSSIKCFARIWQACQVWFTAGRWTAGDNESGTTSSVVVKSLFAQLKFFMIA
jgi:hypothetical protein